MANRNAVSTVARVKAGKTVAAIALALKNKEEAAVRLEYHQARQRQANDLRKQGYMGDDDTVLAMAWITTAVSAVPSLAKWADAQRIHGRKPGPVMLKEMICRWINQPCNGKTRGLVYDAVMKGGE